MIFVLMELYATSGDCSTALAEKTPFEQRIKLLEGKNKKTSPRRIFSTPGQKRF